MDGDSQELHEKELDRKEEAMVGLPAAVGGRGEPGNQRATTAFRV
jgi:hypothetical protein